jgi:hypothetical protein
MQGELDLDFYAGEDAFDESKLRLYTNAQLETFLTAGLQVLEEAPAELVILRTLFGVSGVRAEPMMLDASMTPMGCMTLAHVGYLTIHYPDKLLALVSVCAGMSSTAYHFMWDRKRRQGFVGTIVTMGSSEDDDVTIKDPDEPITLVNWMRLFLSVSSRKVLDLWQFDAYHFVGSIDVLNPCLEKAAIRDANGKFIRFQPVARVDLIIAVFEPDEALTESVARILGALNGNVSNTTTTTSNDEDRHFVATCQIELMGCACSCALRGDAFLPACYLSRLAEYSLPSVQLPGRVYIGTCVREALSAIDVLASIVMQFVSTHTP